MDNKLSELSKPVGFIEQSGMDYLRSGEDADIWPDGGRGDDIPLYSQEYVSALLAELEAKDEALRELAFRVSAGGYNADSVDAEVFKQKIIDGIDSISGVLIKRIDELEAVKADASQVFKEIGNELGCNPDNESIMMAIDALKERLATPVRLPRPACTYADHSYPAYSRKQVEEIITSAGMRFTVEGDSE